MARADAWVRWIVEGTAQKGLCHGTSRRVNNLTMPSRHVKAGGLAPAKQRTSPGLWEEAAAICAEQGYGLRGCVCLCNKRISWEPLERPNSGVEWDVRGDSRPFSSPKWDVRA